MKSVCSKWLRITGIAAAVSAMLLLGTMFSGCRDSENRTSSDEVRQTADDDEKQSKTQQPHQAFSDEVMLYVAEEGDPVTGKPYKIRANRNLQELRAAHGSVTAVNPVTGEKAGNKEWFYVFPKDCLTAHELNHDGTGTLIMTAKLTARMPLPKPSAPLFPMAKPWR
ncbi:MAG: hypothetical protein VZR11_05575 [Succinimonas sp.]|nr:hypothetical protein [Succinimonas sp.]